MGVRQGGTRIPHVFPIAFAALSVTALVAVNPDEGIRLANLTWPLSLAFVVTIIGWAVACLVASGRTAQSLIALAFVGSTLMAGYLFGWTARIFGSSADQLLQPLLALASVIVTVLLVRKSEDLESLGRFLDVMSVILLVLTLPSVLRLLRSREAPLPQPTVAAEGISSRPDIYLVILDAYSGAGSLSSVYGFDNEPMLDSLRDRGFRIPASSSANYTKTFLSVGSMLNRRYPEELVAAAAPEYSDRRLAYEAMEYNQTIVDLMYLGYDIYYVGSSYPPMAENRLAAESESGSLSREFEAMWLSTTILPALVRVWCRLTECDRGRIPFEAEDAASTEGRISLFMAYGTRPGPKFVYMHLLLPHAPFRFGPACEHRPGAWLSDATADDSTGRRLFVEQVRCTNKKLLGIVDHLRNVSGDSAVILLQSDHGHGRFPGGIPRSIDRSSQDQIRERFDVFAAYAGPAGLADSLALVRTPVNLFRTLFRILWDVPEAPMPDLYFWSDPERPLLPIAVDFESLVAE